MNDLRDAFHAAGKRMTSHRRVIMEVLQAGGGHLEVEVIYAQAKARDPHISLATVYRTLGVLKEMGLVEEHRLGEEHSHYESVRAEPHYHFTCVGCGRVIEFDAPLVARIEQELGEQEGVEVLGSHLHITGRCRACRAKA